MMASTLRQFGGRVVYGVRRRIYGDLDHRFQGSFSSHAEATAAVRADRHASYDHDGVADVAYEFMASVHAWDYPILFWLARLTPGAGRILDAGGHMGTKYRAFRDHLDLPDDFDWAIYDVPAIVRAGRIRAEQEGLSALSFHDRLEDTPPSPILLCSGLLQYLDIPLSELVERLPQKPRHLLLNKVATRDGPTVVTHEIFPEADIPYAVRNRDEFEASLSAMGYRIRDTWTISELSYCHRAYGQSVSRGYYAELAGAVCRTG